MRRSCRARDGVAGVSDDLAPLKAATPSNRLGRGADRGLRRCHLPRFAKHSEARQAFYYKQKENSVPSAESLRHVGVNLRSSLFSDVDLSQSTFNDVNLNGASFAKVDLSEVKISNANMSNLSIDDAKLIGASFENVDLSEVKISNANLSNLSIDDANLVGMSIDGVLVTDLFHAYRLQMGG
jgi:uncharacterized protein YjbI with pentapeptide repeats